MSAREGRRNTWPKKGEAGARAILKLRFPPVREPPDWAELVERLERLERRHST